MVHVLYVTYMYRHHFYCWFSSVPYPNPDQKPAIQNQIHPLRHCADAVLLRYHNFIICVCVYIRRFISKTLTKIIISCSVWNKRLRNFSREHCQPPQGVGGDGKPNTKINLSYKNRQIYVYKASLVI